MKGKSSPGHEETRMRFYSLSGEAGTTYEGTSDYGRDSVNK